MMISNCVIPQFMQVFFSFFNLNGHIGRSMLFSALPLFLFPIYSCFLTSLVMECAIICF